MKLISYLLASLWLSCAWCPAAVVINSYVFKASPPSFVAVASAVNSSIAVPSGTANGHFMIAFVGAFNPSTITTPSGWTQVGSTVTWQSGQYSSGLFYRVASSEPSSYTFTSGYYNYGFIATYAGATQVDVAGTLVEKTTSTSMTFTGITSASGSVLLACIHDRDGGTSLTAPSGMTSRLNATSGFGLWQVALADLADADSSNRTWTCGSSSFSGAGVLVSIKP